MKLFTTLIVFFLSESTALHAQTVTDPWYNLAAGSEPEGITVDASGNVYTANRYNSTVSKINAAGSGTDSWATLASGAGPLYIAIDASGNIYTSNTGNNTISKINSSGAVTQSWSLSTTPSNIVIDATGNVYTTGYGNNTVIKISSSGTLSDPWVTLASGTAPFNITIDASGNLYTGNYNNNSGTVSKISSSGSLTQTWASITSGYAAYVYVDAFSGNIYGTTSNSTVFKITAAGIVTDPWITLTNHGSGYRLITDDFGNIYTTFRGGTLFEHTIGKITSAGYLNESWVTLTDLAGAITIDALGNIYAVPISININVVAMSKIATYNTWTGGTSTDWGTASNWSFGAVPVSTDIVQIPSGTTYTPGFTGFSTTVNSLIIASGATLSNSGSSMTVSNAFTNNGIVKFGTMNVGGAVTNNGSVSNNATLNLNGSSAQTISGTGSIANVTINNSAGVTISGGTTTVTGTITPTSGTLTTGGNLVLASSSGNNASIAQGSGSYLSGNVTVQRYIGSNSAWRMIGFPFTQATNISESTLAGFYTSGYNAYTYNEANDDKTNYGNSGTANVGWTHFTSGTTSAKNGILLSGGTISSTINFSGPINTGTQTIALTKSQNGWNFIANPFASAINWTSINTNNASLVNNAIYRYDPGTTAYATYVNASSTGNQSNVIENGAGFFVSAKSAGNLSIAESDKTTGTPLASLFGLQPIITIDKSIIKLSLAKQGDQYADEVVLRWGVDPATDNFDGDYDAYDMGRAVGPDLSVIGNDKTVYSIFHGSALKTNDIENRTVQLGIKNIEEGTYQIGIQLLSAIANGNKAYLYDSYTQQYTLIDGNMDHYIFVSTSDTKSQSNTRFSVIMNAKPITDNNNTNYPITLLNNPSTGNLFTLYSRNNYNQLQWQIVGGSGRLLQAGLLSNVLKGSTHQINAGNTSQGSYFIKLIGDGNALPVLKAIKN